MRQLVLLVCIAAITIATTPSSAVMFPGLLQGKAGLSRDACLPEPAVLYAVHAIIFRLG
jgi:hypothetical protein